MNREESNRLKKIRGFLGLTQEEMGNQLGKPRTVWTNYETGRSEIPADVYMKLEKMGFNIEWLKTGAGSMKAEAADDELLSYFKYRSGAGIRLPGNVSSDIVLVDFYPLEVSAGYGHKIDIQDDIQQIPILRSIIYPFQPGQIKALMVRGDSMIDSNISDGDIALFAPSIQDGNGIFIVTVDNKAFVKRIEFDPFGQWVRLLSDNPRYEPQKIGIEHADTFRIEGKVIAWIHKNRE